MKIHLLALALLTPALLPAQEANPFVKAAAEEATELVSDDVITGTLSFRVPRKLLPTNSAPADADAAPLLAQAWKWVEEGKAVLEDSSVVTGGSGEMFRTESISEILYPTEWVTAPAGAWPGPCAIETRNTGFTQEWEPTLQGNSVAIRAALDHTRFAGCRDYFPLVAATRQPGDMTCPLFESDRATTQYRVPRGAWFLASRNDRSGDGDLSRLCFARVDQRVRKPAQPLKDVKVVRGTLEWIEVDHPAFAAWWAKTPLSDAATGGARLQAERMIAAGQGSVVSSQPFQSNPGDRGTVESLREVIYPTDFDPPFTPQVAAPQAPGADDHADGEAAKKPVPPPVAAGTYPSEGYGAAWIGCSYETRNTGFSTEFEVVSVNGLWGVRLAVENVKDVGEIVMRRIKVNDQWIPDAKMPHFYCERINTGFHLEPNLPLLVGVVAPPDAEGNPDPAKRHLVFLTLNPEK